MPIFVSADRLLRAAGAGVALALCAPPAAAWENNHIHMIIGERPLGMGGAYTAISDDPSGLYYNPAGIVYGHAPNLSASVNSWQWTESQYKDALGSSDDFERDSSELLPNFFGTTQRLGPVTVGISYAVTRAVREDQIQYFKDGQGFDAYTVNIDNQDTETKIGPSVAYEINSQASVGFTLYLHSRQRKTITNQIVEWTDRDQPQWQNTYYSRKETGIEPVLGALWNLGNRLAAGISVRTTTVLSSTTITQATCHGHSDLSTEQTDLCRPESVGHQAPTESSSRQTYPLEVRFGTAYFATRNLLLAADAIYYSETSDGHETTWNLAGGLEYYLSSRWAMRGGLFTNHAFTPEIDFDGETTDRPEHINYYGGTLSISHFARNSSVTLGLTHAMGRGKAQIVGGRADVQDVTASSTGLFLGTSYSY